MWPLLWVAVMMQRTVGTRQKIKGWLDCSVNGLQMDVVNARLKVEEKTKPAEIYDGDVTLNASNT